MRRPAQKKQRRALFGSKCAKGKAVLVLGGDRKQGVRGAVVRVDVYAIAHGLGSRSTLRFWNRKAVRYTPVNSTRPIAF
jgi:hypothetical protein